MMPQGFDDDCDEDDGNNNIRRIGRER